MGTLCASCVRGRDNVLVLPRHKASSLPGLHTVSLGTISPARYRYVVLINVLSPVPGYGGGACFCVPWRF